MHCRIAADGTRVLTHEGSASASSAETMDAKADAHDENGTIPNGTPDGSTYVHPSGLTVVWYLNCFHMYYIARRQKLRQKKYRLLRPVYSPSYRTVLRTSIFTFIGGMAVHLPRGSVTSKL